MKMILRGPSARKKKVLPQILPKRRHQRLVVCQKPSGTLSRAGCTVEPRPSENRFHVAVSVNSGSQSLCFEVEKFAGSGLVLFAYHLCLHPHGWVQRKNPARSDRFWISGTWALGPFDYLLAAYDTQDTCRYPELSSSGFQVRVKNRGRDFSM